MVPGLESVLHGGGVGMLGRQAVFKTHDLHSGDQRQFGAQNAGVAQRAAGIAAAVTIEDNFPVVVASMGPDPGAVHFTQQEGLPAHASHWSHQTAQQFLIFSLLSQIFHVHDLGRSGAVDGLQSPHKGRQTLLFRPLAGKFFPFRVVFHVGIPPQESGEGPPCKQHYSIG